MASLLAGDFGMVCGARMLSRSYINDEKVRTGLG